MRWAFILFLCNYPVDFLLISAGNRMIKPGILLSLLFFLAADAGASVLQSAVTGSFEPLLPAMKFRKFGHYTLAGIYQSPDRNLGGFSAFWNYSDFCSDYWNDNGRKTLKSGYQEIFALSWGFDFESFELN
jgi:hypothetical protein